MSNHPLAAAARGTESGSGARAGSRFRLIFPVVPFAAFAFAFLIAPAGIILSGSFLSADGSLTFANFLRLGKANIVSAYRVTVELAALTAAAGCLAGLAIAWQLETGRLPLWAKKVTMSFCGVASNFAGVPLAFAFIAALGRTGIVTGLLKGFLRFDPYAHGFTLYSFSGLAIAYLYFQIPLMVLVIMPAVEAVRNEWLEAARSLGVSRSRYWTGVLIPILAPPVLSSFLLLFGNAFGAYATAYALTGGMLNLVTILIGAQIRGDVLHDPNLGYALAAGMVAIMAFTTISSSMLTRRFSRWIR